MENKEMTSSKSKRYPKYFNTTLFALTLTGFWTSATDKRINMKAFSFFYGLNVLGIIGSLASLYETEEYNVYSVFEALIYIPLHLCAIIGCGHLVRKRDLMQKLFIIAEDGYSSFDDSANEKAVLARNKADADARYLVRCVSWVITCAHFFKFISTEAWNPYSSNKIPFIPISLFFYKSDSLLFYYLMYILQFITSASCGTLNVICIVVGAGLCNIISAEIDALKFAFEDANCLQIVERKKVEEYVSDGQGNARITYVDDNQAYHRLKSLVKQHINLIRTRKELELLISPVAFSMFVLSEFIVCFCTFQIYQLYATMDMPILINRMTLFAALMAQQFVYFVAGQTLETKSEDLHRFLYYCTWYKNSLKFNSGLRIMFERTKTSFILKAGYLIPINLRSFVTCMQATFSYFNLLRALSSNTT